jgi:hypothetical protein
MTASAPIWTRATRAYMYEYLVEHFGPHNEWPHVTMPADKDAYIDFLELYARIVGAKSGAAVAIQINYAICDVMPSNGRERPFILNKAEAFYAGFIGNADISDIG